MIPGEVITVSGDIELNVGAPTVTLEVSNTGDRPVQVGSHYHFAETNGGLSFERDKGHAAGYSSRHRRAFRAGPDALGDPHPPIRQA